MVIRRNPPLPVQRLVIPYSYCFCLYDGLFTVVILSAGSIFPSGTLGATTFYRCCPNPHYHTFAPSPTVLLRPHLRQHLKLDLVFLATATESGVLVLALIWCRPVRSRLRLLQRSTFRYLKQEARIWYEPTSKSSLEPSTTADAPRQSRSCVAFAFGGAYRASSRLIKR